MNDKEYTQTLLKSTALEKTTTNYLLNNELFKNYLKSVYPNIAADIESASTNPTCTCVDKIQSYIYNNKYEFIENLIVFLKENKLEKEFMQKHNEVEKTTKGIDISGRVSKVMISDWKEFVYKLKNQEAVYTHMSTSVVGDEVYVFFA